MRKPSPELRRDTRNRINLEHAIVRRTVKALLAAGYALATDEGEHRFFGPVCPTTSYRGIIKQLAEVDEEHLGVFTVEEANGETRVCKPFAWVHFVYGNDGWDVMSNYTLNLEDVLKPVNAYAEAQS